MAAISVLLIIIGASLSLLLFIDDDEVTEDVLGLGVDPIPQGEGHDHRAADQHDFSSSNFDYVDFHQLTTPGNAEIQVKTSPDGRTYVYQAGWREMHITDVTDPSNIILVSKYVDENTQVLDIKYLEYGGREYIILQNQLVQATADPQVGEWEDPAQVSVTLIDVTDKEDPCYVDSWYDTDHPTGPHNLYTHKIDGEWYIFVANPEYEACDAAIGEACGGITIAHINMQIANSLDCTVPMSRHGSSIFKVGEAEVSWENTRGGWIYIHDMTVQTWPGEDSNDPRFGKTFIYGAYWEAGLRIFDVSDVPHPTNSPELYTLVTATCKAGGGNPLICRWRAPEVGQWMDFADLDHDGQPDSSTTANVNGGRASYIHYVEPYPVMVDTTHLGGPSGKRHLTTLATEVLSTSHGTGLVYLLDTTDYRMENGNFRFLPKLYSSWEIPGAEDHCFGADCPINPDGAEWLLFSPHNLDSVFFETGEEGKPDNSYGSDWDGRLYMGNYHSGVWVLDVETMIARGIVDQSDGEISDEERRATDLATVVGYYVPHGPEDGTELPQEYYDHGFTPMLWTTEWHEGYTYVSCGTSGLYVIQLDIDKPYMSLEQSPG